MGGYLGGGGGQRVCSPAPAKIIVTKGVSTRYLPFSSKSKLANEM